MTPQGKVLTIFATIFFIAVFCIFYVIYDETAPRETITSTIIDKWIDPNRDDLSIYWVEIYWVELEDHRIFAIRGFDYQQLELNKPYKLKVYKQYVKIIDQRWRI
jgi:hypothetical protein